MNSPAKFNPTELTKQEIKKATTFELINLYNELTGKSIKGFHTRTKGEEQVWKAVQQHGKTWYDAKVKDQKEFKKEFNSKKDGKRNAMDSKIIQILVKENPKRVGSRAFAKFAILMKYDGKTIGEFKKEEGRHSSLDMEKGWTSTELRWARDREAAKYDNKN